MVFPQYRYLDNMTETLEIKEAKGLTFPKTITLPINFTDLQFISKNLSSFFLKSFHRIKMLNNVNDKCKAEIPN